VWGTLRDTTIVESICATFCIHLDGMQLLVRFASSNLIFYSVIDNKLWT
jgi:hypothetical protein